jgi:hypothetical protein
MHVDPTLESMTAADPNARTPVVVTLKRGTAESASSLGVPEAQEVAPGIFTAMLNSEEIQQLSRKGEVEAIESDQSVGPLGG